MQAIDETQQDLSRLMDADSWETVAPLLAGCAGPQRVAPPPLRKRQ